MEEIYLTEQHSIKRGDPRWSELDTLCFAAKNLWNVAMYEMRQAFFAGQEVPGLAYLCQLLKQHETYTALPRKVSVQVLHNVIWAWSSYFVALKAYRERPSDFLGKPRPPGYKHKTKGRAVTTWTNQAVSIPLLRRGIVKLSGTQVEIPTRQRKIQQVRLVPRADHYVVEVVYRHVIVPPEVPLNTARIAGIDLGLNNLLTLATNTLDTEPLTINGGPLKAINNYYNKKRTRLQGYVPNQSSHALRSLTQQRNRLVKSHLHIISRKIIHYLVNSDIGTLVIGYNKNWKQHINLGRVTNQRFVGLPFEQLVHMLNYKALLAGITVVMQEEAYTSKCSFFDGEVVKKHMRYKGKRVSRGLFRTSSGLTVNADLNGAYNIIRKAFPQAFADVGDYPLHPVRVNLPRQVAYCHGS
jgi:IS605 OrfB family transposase